VDGLEKSRGRTAISGRSSPGGMREEKEMKYGMAR
jgi:hypothetical protein